MIRLLISVLGAIIILSGCASQYYYKVNNNNVHIYLNEPKAKEVYLLSSLDQFKRHEAMKNKNGVWEVMLPSGMEFRYFFIVDGSVYIPTCEQKERDDFGSENCLFVPEI